jgi:pectinesterase
MLLPGHAPAREVDDSYAIGQRFAQYRDKFPGIAWPAVTWKAGQSVLFDRPYKNTGTRDLHIDVFRPSAGANRQGILLVHGGGWRAGGAAAAGGGSTLPTIPPALPPDVHGAAS